MKNDRFKFRGFDEENKVWRHGHYTKLVDGIRKYDAIIESTDNELVGYYIHDQSSIKQCTGLKDKNGVLIFEGDALKLRDCGADVIVIVKPPELIECDAFVCYAYAFCSGQHIDDYSNPGLGRFYDCEPEVIGNIYENPELLTNQVNETEND